MTKQTKDARSNSVRRRHEPQDLDLRVKRSTAGLGLFAGEPIARGACVIEYVGDVLNAADYAHSRSSYLFDVGGDIWVDGSPRWNTARYINHSCAPNCEPIIRKRRIFIHALRNIEPGEELTYNYGSEFFDAKIGDKCRCTKCAPELYADAAAEAGKRKLNGASGRKRGAPGSAGRKDATTRPRKQMRVSERPASRT